MNEAKKKAFDAALALTNQLISLATGVLALSATFLKDIVGILRGGPARTAPPCCLWLLYTSWVLTLLSILCGLGTNSAITGHLAGLPEDDSKADLFDPGITRPSIAQ